MSEYWKSTPKYWCKHCSTYVKDTKFERAQHEATGKHQGNLRRFLRGIQDGQERGEREKQRAKAEVDRVNKIVGATATSPTNDNAATNRKPSSLSDPPQVSVTERKKHLAQLAQMGIAVPDEFRADMAIAGDWKVMSQRPVQEGFGEEPRSVGVRKRKLDGQDEDEEASEVVARRKWGSTSRRYPEADDGETANLDALLSGVKSVKKEETAPDLQDEDSEEKSALLSAKTQSLHTKTEQAENPISTAPVPVKKEESTNHSEQAKSSLRDIPSTEEALGADVVFKKRKAKTTRGK